MPELITETCLNPAELKTYKLTDLQKFVTYSRKKEQRQLKFVAALFSFLVNAAGFNLKETIKAKDLYNLAMFEAVKEEKEEKQQQFNDEKEPDKETSEEFFARMSKYISKTGANKNV